MSLGPDIIVGGVLGAVGAQQGVALPGALLMGLILDASAALAYQINPSWFPRNRCLSIQDVLATAFGVTAGWMAVRALGASRVNPSGAVASPVPSGAITAVALGTLVLTAGRAPGRLPVK